MTDHDDDYASDGDDYRSEQKVSDECKVADCDRDRRKPAEVLVEGSYFAVSALPTILGNFMRANLELGREVKGLYLFSEKMKNERDAALAVIAEHDAGTIAPEANPYRKATS